MSVILGITELFKKPLLKIRIQCYAISIFIIVLTFPNSFDASDMSGVPRPLICGHVCVIHLYRLVHMYCCPLQNENCVIIKWKRVQYSEVTWINTNHNTVKSCDVFIPAPGNIFTKRTGVLLYDFVKCQSRTNWVLTFPIALSAVEMPIKF